MGYRHSANEINEAVIAVALQHGIAALTYRKVAEHLGISDRMVVYYLPTKADLVQSATTALAASLQQLLARAFGDEPNSPNGLLAAAWPVFTTPDADRATAIFLEIVGLAAAATDPYPQIAKAVVADWVDWVAPRVDAPTPAARRQDALGIIARIEGLLVIRHTLGAHAAKNAARALAIPAHHRNRGKPLSLESDGRTIQRQAN